MRAQAAIRSVLRAASALLVMMFDFLMATLIASGGFLAVLALSLNIMALAGDAESAYLKSVEAANRQSEQRLQRFRQQRRVPVVQLGDFSVSHQASSCPCASVCDAAGRDLT